MKTIVLGAYGFTGELVCQVLSEKNMPFAVAGRKFEALQELKGKYEFIDDLHILEMKDKSLIEKLVDEYDIFINCVGPFYETADILLQNLTAQKKMYVDITGEIEFVHESREKYHKKAVENSATVIHSCAFESVLVNLLAHRIIDDTNKVASIQSFYITGRSKASPGTKLTMKLAKFRNDFHYKDGKAINVRNVDSIEIEKTEDSAIIASPFALPEICFAKWDTSATDIGTFMLMDQYDASFVKKDFSNIDMAEKDRLLAKFDKRRPPGPKVELRESQAFTIDVKVIDSEGQERAIFLEGKDYYLLSAEIAVYFTRKYQAGAGKSTGVISPISFLGKKNRFFEDFKMKPDEK